MVERQDPDAMSFTMMAIINDESASFAILNDKQLSSHRSARYPFCSPECSISVGAARDEDDDGVRSSSIGTGGSTQY